ncbi:MAG: homoserine kinase [Deinococcota bacterium]
MLAVRVPATSANLGPGFDVLGLAVSLYCEVTMTLSEEDHFYYQDAKTRSSERETRALPDTPDNLIHEGFRKVYESLGEQAPKVTFEVHNAIPLARGLGSSSAALVAGAALADKYLGEPLGRTGVFQLAARLEGHPDNVAPAVFGGFTLSAGYHANNAEAITYLCEHLPLPEAWQLVFAVPDFELLTSESRSVLPDNYDRSDVVFTSSRTALWSLAVSQNNPELLRVASQDVLHESYREKLIPNMAACRQKLLDVGALAVYLSGAGPTLAAICLGEVVTTQCEVIMRQFVGEAGAVLNLRASEGYQYL